MGVYIKNWSLADWKDLLKWAKIGLNNAMIGEFTEVEEVPPHGRLIDADAFIATIRPLCEEDAFAACTFATVKQLMAEHINKAPTIVEAEEGET